MTLLQKNTICDSFTLINTGDVQDKIGIKTIGFKSRITGEREYIQFDPYAEVLVNASSPLRGGVFLNRLANAGFQVSPMPNALETFFHATLFPEDVVTLMGGIKAEQLPKNAVVEVISTGETKENQYEH